MAVKIEISADTSQISKDLSNLSKEAQGASQDISNAAKANAETLDSMSNKSKRSIFDLRSITKSFYDDMLRGLKMLANASAVTNSFKLPQLIGETLKATNQLNEFAKKFGEVFGIAKDDFVDFEARLVRGMGKIGQSADVVRKSLQGLVQTPVRDKDAIEEYVKVSAQLASISGTQGEESAIAGSMAGVLQARGINPNDTKQVAALAEQTRQIFNATGRDPADILDEMRNIFAKLPIDLKKTITPQAIGSIFAARTAGGEGSTKFLEEYLGKSKLERMVFEEFGGGDLFKNGQLDIEAFKKFSQNASSLISMDPRKSAEILGISPEAAEGMRRLSENIDLVNQFQSKLAKSTGDLNDQFKDSKTLMEALKGNINRTTSHLNEPINKVSDYFTDLLKLTGESDVGSAAVVAGGVLGSLVLGGKGLGSLAGSLGGTAAKTLAAEKIFGEKTIPVYVTNFGEISGGIGGSGSNLMGKVAAGGAALAAGSAVGYYAQPLISGAFDAISTGTTDGYTGNAIDRLIYKIDQLLGSPTGIAKTIERKQEIDVRLKIEQDKTEKMKIEMERGASY